ncbi:Receptor-like protein 6 [Camellia lanceoleosa]|uniref:Receptor-like protein 6 n=1 Tax=Camellia lanceoleosa TaxID=1840588 RepID=A0ACC0G925_9ERIC|nr:Receptor-like protein 6 [Camellia lanceoleosa]
MGDHCAGFPNIPNKWGVWVVDGLGNVGVGQGSDGRCEDVQPVDKIKRDISSVCCCWFAIEKNWAKNPRKNIVQTGETPKKCATKSNIAGIVKIVSTSGLTEAHRVHMRKTPFWLLFEAILEHDLNQQDFRKCDELVFKLIETYVPSSGSFRIGNGMVTLRDSDYFLCEHTTLVDAANPDVFPRFLKWNVSSLLTKMRTVTLSDGDAFEVNPGRLQVTSYERAQLTGECSMTGLVYDDFVDMNDAHTVGDGGCEAVTVNVNDSNDASHVLGDGVAVGGKLFIGQPSGQSFGVDEMTEGNVRCRQNGDGAPVDSTNECTQRRIIVLEAEQKAKDFLIAKLEEQVAKLTKALEQQASNLFVGFNDCLKVKEDEIARLTNVVNDLRKTITGLEVQIGANVGCTTAGSPHANAGGNDSDSFAFVDEKNAEEVIHDVTQNAVGKLSGSSEANRAADVVRVGHVVGGLQDEVLLGSSLQNSFVWNIKGKIRRERKLPEYEYPMLRGQLRKVGTHDRQCVAGDVGGNYEIMLCDEVIRIDGIGEQEKKRAVVWTGRNGDIFVYFSDIKNIVRQSVIRGNVIDACAELLLSKQNVLCGGEVFPEKSYFFSSVCLKENVLNFIREKQQSSNGGEVLFTQGHDSVLEVVTDSPTTACGFSIGLWPMSQRSELIVAPIEEQPQIKFNSFCQVDLLNLRSLHLCSSNLHGRFPEKIFRVSTLEALDLSYNRLLRGFLPQFPPNGSLHTPVLSNTNFSGTLPDSVGNLKMLSRMELPGCNFNRLIPNTMANLTQLVYLDLSSKSFTGLGFGIGAGVIIGPLLFWKQGSKWCNKHIEMFVQMILPSLGFIFAWCDYVKVEPKGNIEEETQDDKEDSDEDEDENAREDKAFSGAILCVLFET